MAKRKMQTIEGRENQLISLAFDEVERRLKNGTISSQLLNTLIQSGTVRAQKMLEKLDSDIKVSNAKVKYMESQENSEEVAREAMEAIRRYRRNSYDDGEEE